LYLQDTGAHKWFTAPSGTAGNAITFTQAMTLDASGRLGIGTTTPDMVLDVSGGAVNTAFRLNSTSNASQVLIGLATDDRYRATFSIANSSSDLVIKSEDTGGRSAGIQFWTGNASAERARIDSSGNFLLGTTSILPSNLLSAKLHVLNSSTSAHAASFKTNATSGFAAAAFSRDGNNGGVCEFLYNPSTTVGSISVTSSLTTYNVTSDYRLKTVIGPVANAGQRIDALQPVEYTWNSDGSRTRGFLAHQFQEVYAGSVTGTKDAVDAEGKPVYQQMQASTSEVIADLVAELQSLRARVAALESN
jgi:hypothetical protein